MFKTFTFLFVSAIAITFLSCSRAAEDRQQMHARAKIFQDSIANLIRTQMAEAEAPGPVQMAMPVPQPTPGALVASPPATPSKTK